MSVLRTASVLTLIAAVGLTGCSLFRRGERAEVAQSQFAGPTSGARPGEIGVNSFLWRATLDTLAFMPLASADPFGGVIITDWYINPETPTERFKATVYILDSRLRADGLNVSLYKETRDAAGGWTAAPVTPQTETDVENAILTRARQLRLSTIGG